MNKKVISARFFAKAEGASSTWRDRLAKLKGKTPPKATAKLEIADQATGENMIFPEIGDVSEIREGVTVTATDGEHVFVADATTYTVEVANGVVTSVTETPTDAATASSPETTEFVEAVAEALGEHEAFKTEATAQLAELKTALATAQQELKDFKATMSHGGDGTGANGAAATGGKTVSIGGKKIDLNKINIQ